MFCIENKGIEQTVSFKATAKLSEKERMYAYLRGPLLDAVVRAYIHAGYSFMDKNKALFLMKCESAMEPVFDPIKKVDREMPMETSAMSKARLLQFIQDIILFIEMQFGFRAPDSEEWKSYQIYGKKLKSVKWNQENENNL